MGKIDLSKYKKANISVEDDNIQSKKIDLSNYKKAENVGEMILFEDQLPKFPNLMPKERNNREQNKNLNGTQLKRMPTFIEETDRIRQSAMKYSKEPSKKIEKNKKQSKEDKEQAKKYLELAKENLGTKQHEYDLANKTYHNKLSEEYKKNNIDFWPKFESNKKVDFKTKDADKKMSGLKEYDLEKVNKNSEADRKLAEDKLNELKFAQYQYDSAKVNTEDTTYFDRTLGNVVRGAKDLGSVFDVSSSKYKGDDGKTYFLPSYNQLKQEKVSGDYKSGLGKILGDSTYNATKILGSTVLDAITGGFGGKATYWTDMAADNFQNVKNQGYDNSKALANTLVSTGSEFLTEKLIGGVAKGLTGGKSSQLSNIIGDKATKIVKSPKVANIIGSAGSEAVEEFAQEYIDNLNMLATLENSTDVKDYLKVFNKDTFKDALYSAGVGAVSGGALSAINNRDGKQVDNNIKVFENIKDQLETKKNTLTNQDEITKYDKAISNIDNYLSKPFSNNNENIIKQISDDVSAFNLNKQQDAESKSAYAQNLNKNSINDNSNNKMINFMDSAKRYNIDTNNDTMKTIDTKLSERGILAKFDSTEFINSNENAFWRSKVDENGQVIREVVFNPNAKTNDLLQNVAVHELYHDISNTKEGQNISSQLLEFASTKDGYSETRQSLEQLYSQKYDSTSTEFKSLIDEEVTASILGKKIGDQEFISQLTTEKPSLSKSVYNWIIDKLNKLNKLTGYKKEKIFWNDIKNKFNNAYRSDYVSNGLNTRYSIVSDDSGNKYVNIDTNQDIFNGKNVYEQTKIAKRYILDNFRNRNLSIDNSGISVTTKTANEYTHPRTTLQKKDTSSKMKASTELDNLLAVSEYKYSKPDDGRHSFAKDGWDYYETKFKIGNIEYTGLINVAKNGNKKMLYDITQLKRNTLISSPVDTATESIGIPFSNKNISQYDNNVNSDTFTKYSIQNQEKNTFPIDESSSQYNESVKYSKNVDGWNEYLNKHFQSNGTGHTLSQIKEKTDVSDRVQSPMQDSDNNVTAVSNIPKNVSMVSTDNISQRNNYINSNTINKVNQNNNIGANMTNDVLKIDSQANTKKKKSFDIQTIRDNQPYSQELKSIEAKIFKIQNEITSNPDVNTNKVNELIGLIEKRKELHNILNSPKVKSDSKINPYIEMHNQLAEENNGNKIDVPKYKDMPSDPNSLVDDNKKISVNDLKKDNKMWGAVQELVVNRNHYIDKFSKETGNKQIKYAGDQLNNFRGSADWNINVYQQDSNGNKIGSSLKEIFTASKKEGLDKVLDDYLIHKSNIDRAARNKGMANVTQAESLQFVQDIEKKYPQVKEYSKNVQTYIENLRNRMVDAGLMSTEMAETLKETNPNYVPYYEELDSLSVEKSADKLMPKKVVKRAKGGASNILNIEKALGRYSYSVEKAIAQNDLYKEIVSTIKERENIGFDDRKDAADLSQSLYIDEKTGKRYLSAFFNGEMVTAPISVDLYNELDSKNHKAQQFVDYLEESFETPLKAIKKANNIRRNLLTTWNPVFFLTNPLKDIQDATINSTDVKGFTKNYSKAMYEATKYSDNYMKFIAKYGIDSTQGIYSNDSKVNLISNDKGVSNLRNKTANFINKVASVNEILEMTPRYAEYMTTLENGGTLNEALYNAREVTTNFGRGGIIAKALNNNGFTFLNASIQGFDKLCRNFSKQNGAKAFTNILIKSIVIGMTPSVINHLLLDDDEDYKDTPNYVKDNYYLFKGNDGKLNRLPKGRVIGFFGSTARRVLEGATGEENSFDDYLSSSWSQVGFNDLSGNNLLSPINQAFGSKNGTAWYGGDIVSSRLQSEKPKNQYDEKTDEFSKWLGGKINVSPKKINYVLDQYSGGVGDILLPFMTKRAENGSDNIISKLGAPLRDKFTTDSVINNKNISIFYDTLEKYNAEQRDKNAKDEDVLSYKYLYTKSREISELYNKKRDIENSNKKDSVKYKESRDVQKTINTIAKEALNNYKKVKKSGSDYAIVGEFAYKKKKDKPTGEYKWTKQNKK